MQMASPAHLSALESVLAWAGKTLLARSAHLVRDGAVDLVREFRGAGEWIKARVLNGQKMSVVERLRCADYEDFYCSCGGALPCEHVVAARIAALTARDPRLLDHPLLQQEAATGDLPLDVLRWLDRLQKAAAANGPDEYPPEVKDRLLYVLGRGGADSGYLDRLQVIHSRVLRVGGFSKTRRPFTGWDDYSYRYGGYAGYGGKSYVLEADKRIRRELVAAGSEDPRGRGYAIAAKDLQPVMRMIVSTGRCYVDGIDGSPLHAAPPRPGKLDWQISHDGNQRLAITCEPSATHVIATTPAWYVDQKTGACGPIEIDVSPALLAVLFDAPALRAEEAGRLAVSLPAMALESTVPPPRAVATEIVKGIVPRPSLHLRWMWFEPERRWVGDEEGGEERCWAEISFDYGEGRVAEGAAPREFRTFAPGKVRIIERDFTEEARRFAQIGEAGLKCRSDAAEYVIHSRASDGTFWLSLQANGLPALRQAGWDVVVEANHPFLLAGQAQWQCTVAEGAGGWFDVGLGVMIEGQVVDLVPILSELLSTRALRQNLGKPIDGKGKVWYSKLPDGRWIAVPAERAQRLLLAFAEIESKREGGKLRISRYDLGAIAELDRFDAVRFEGGEHLRRLARDLGSEPLSTAFPIPPSLETVLRSYQRIGFQWLQVRARHGLGGILGDDMGLGKTLQVQAHLLAEKLAGRATRPSLAIVPRSVLRKWEKEIRQFTPQLQVRTLHGQERHAEFAAIDGCDLVLTTYALLIRDREALAKRAWHCVILDEAHTIRNPGTKAAHAACALEAHHRIAVTGTPIQNTLSDLWSIMHFGAPGLLRSEKWFKENLRTPIERENDPHRRELLRRMIRPFLLRRTKKEVMAELPPLTETMRTIVLEGGQRDLYEVIRASMEDRVRQEIFARGLGRSRVMVLQALLQLRQVCCDPRLLKIEAAKDCESAKLETCRELIAELLAEGRRVLLFSNFTSVLDLIKVELDALGVTWAEIVGGTRDRERPQEAFRSGRAQVLLASEKAGGEGLDLQAADTVILYEPWWNPTTESQAAGRAHRSGQAKPVLLIRLIVEGSVEERMLAMQAKKQGLVDAILSDSAKGIETLSMKDVELLLSPLDRVS